MDEPRAGNRGLLYERRPLCGDERPLGQRMGGEFLRRPLLYYHKEKLRDDEQAVDTDRQPIQGL